LNSRLQRLYCELSTLTTWTAVSGQYSFSACHGSLCSNDDYGKPS